MGPALREETETALRDAVEEAAGTCAEQMEQVDGPARRRHACDAYARRIRDGALDIGFERPEVKAMLDARPEGTRGR